MNWNRWTNKRTGARMAAVRVEFYIEVDDLVGAAMKVIDDLVDTYEPEDTDIDAAAAKLSRAKIDTMVVECLRSYGSMWMESSDNYLNTAGWTHSLIRLRASEAVTRLYPEAVA